MSGVLRLANTGGSNGRSTIVAAASTDATFTLPPTGGTLLTTSFDTIGDITWNGSNINITNADLNVNSGQLFVDEDTGFVGIGTTTPACKLTVRDTIVGGSALLQVNNEVVNSYGGLRIELGNIDRECRFRTLYGSSFFTFHTEANTGGPVERVRIDSDGRVGIGIQSPSSRLHLKGGSLTTEHLSPSTGTGQFNINCENNSQVSFSYDDQGHISFGTANTPATQNGFTERMRLDNSGRLGINLTPSDNSRLQIAGSMRFAGAGDASDSVNPVIYRVSGQDDLAFATAASERMRIDSSGRLLLGTGNPNNRAGGFNNAFQVEGETAAQSSISIIRNSNDQNPTYLNFGKSRGTTLGSNSLVSNGDVLTIIDFTGSDGSNSTFRTFASIRATVNGETSSTSCPGRLAFWTTPEGSTGASERMVIDNLGRVTVKTSQASNARNRVIQLECSGQGRGAILSGNSDTDPATFGSGSDRRLKTNIREYTGGLEKIKQIPVKIYDETNTDATDVVGWIADEISTVFPNAVIGEPNAVDAEGNPEYQMLASLKFYPDLIQCVQTLVTKIEALEAEVSKLRSN